MEKPNVSTVYVHPGYVFSGDGDMHYIGAQALIKLYKLDPRQCKVVTDRDRILSYRADKSKLRVFPLSSGKYEAAANKLHKAIQCL